LPIAGPAVNLTPGKTFALVAPITPSVNQVWQVVLDNPSPWALVVKVGSQSYSLPAAVTQRYGASSGPAEVTVTTPPVGVGGYSLGNTWAVAPDSIPGTYPSPIGPIASTPNPLSIAADETLFAPLTPVTMIPPVAGESLRVFAALITVLTGVASGVTCIVASLPSGTKLMEFVVQQGFAFPFPFIIPPAGIVFPPGQGLSIATSDTASGAWTIAYTQAVNP
jgi:hypothetical protein